jgi:formylmethanofuran dehydrogenase subunit C
VSETITLTAKGTQEGRVDASAITPDRLATLSAAAIAALPLHSYRLPPVHSLRSANRTHVVPLGEMFTISGERSSSVRIAGDLRALDALGCGMTAGTLTIEGDVGDDLGRAMVGGSIDLRGSAGHRVGMTMRGGTISISGHAGDQIGGPLPGGSRGMSGGEIVVRGSAGRDAGFCGRRGLIIIGGDAADGSARSMIAGTVIVIGRALGSVGCWNKRGTLVALGGADVPGTYRYACTYSPTFLRLVFAHVRRTHRLYIEDRFMNGRYSRYCGDLSELGLGEILTWTDS